MTLLTLIVLAIPATSYVFAGDDNVGFRFRIPGGSGNPNGQEADGRYRQTRHWDNPFKVDLNSSGEGDGTTTKFWLENYKGKNVSEVKSVRCRGPVVYGDGKEGSEETTVYLTAEKFSNNRTQIL
jgi:hypothetical protein